MVLREPKKEYVRVALKDRSGKSITFTVYETTKESLAEFIKNAIEDSCS